MQPPDRRPDPRVGSVALLASGVAGVALCITLVYLGMRAVMDIGGACADGGPYVSANPCPDGVPAALILAIFGLFLFGGLAMVGAAGTGGYGWLPLLAWTALFATLGWNFLDYGLLNPPEGEGIVWGYAIPGVLFQLMAWIPVVVLVAGIRQGRRWRAASGTSAQSQSFPEHHPADDAGGTRPPVVPASHRVEVAGPGREQALQAIDGALGALVLDAAAAARVAAPAAGRAEAAVPGESQAVVDRLERLGEMRRQGLLTADEYETAKRALMRELEGAS